MIKKSPPIIPCSSCGGTGKARLTPKLWQTLQAVSGKPITTADIAKKLKLQGNAIVAINARLQTLIGMNLVTRDEEGKAYTYTATSTKGVAP